MCIWVIVYSLSVNNNTQKLIFITMYKCVSVHVCTCERVHVQLIVPVLVFVRIISMHTYMRTRVSACVYKCVRICLYVAYVCMHDNESICIHMYLCMSVCVCMRMWTQMCTFKCVFTCTHVATHAQIRTSGDK